MNENKTENFKNKLKNKRSDLTDSLELIGEYIDSRTKIRFKDKYGILLISPNYILFRSGKPSIVMAEDKTLYFINKANEIHNNEYDYSKTVYVNNRTLINIICPKHGSFFVTPDSHLKGSKCSVCQSTKNGDKKINKHKHMFVDKANKIHKNKYIYDLFTYENAICKSSIICPLHGCFQQSAHAHLTGRGCPKCGIINKKHYYKNNSYYNEIIAERNKNEWIHKNAYLYFIKCFNEDESFYKVGICKEKNIKKRFSSMKYNVEIQKIFKTNLYNAVIREQIIHSELIDFKYEPKIKFGGHNECYVVTMTDEYKEKITL